MGPGWVQNVERVGARVEQEEIIANAAMDDPLDTTKPLGCHGHTLGEGSARILHVESTTAPAERQRYC